ncbi:MAG TPA: hypothetical protein DCO77_00660, partial [Nitrospiraceae bacterium]|nr:hypothetical protein [Nitrospiraceae bacterium]
QESEYRLQMKDDRLQRTDLQTTVVAIWNPASGIKKTLIQSKFIGLSQRSLRLGENGVDFRPGGICP